MISDDQIMKTQTCFLQEMAQKERIQPSTVDLVHLVPFCLSLLLVVAGTHGCQDGQLGDNDSTFADQSERFLGWFKKKYKEYIEKSNITMEVKDISQHKDGRKVEEGFISVLKEFDPTVLTVLLLAFC